MLKISRLTDYGVLLATELASYEEPVSSRSLSAATKLPEPTVSKVLKALSKGGIVEAKRGAHGGYLLTRAAGEITVEEIVTALDGPIAITDCSGDSEIDCEHITDCKTKANWQRINLAIQQALGGISLADMGAGSNLVHIHPKTQSASK